MNPDLIPAYQQKLGLKPVFLPSLLDLEGDAAPHRIATVERGRCVVLGLDGDGSVVEQAVFPPSDPVAVGDWVVVEPGPDDQGRIVRVLERTTVLERGSVGKPGQSQLIAANLDTVFVVVAFAETAKLERRSLRARRLDRFVAAIKQGGAEPVVVVNKVDLARRADEELDLLRRELSTRLGAVEVLVVGALPSFGLEALRERAPAGDTVAFVGPSGVGKSSLINALLGEERQKTGAVRSSDTKGRHTTTRRELLSLPSGGWVVDTPGVREFAITSEENVAGFEDVEALATECRFADCAHESEPSCAVLAAVDRGELAQDRLESYRDLEKEARRFRAKHDAYARHQERMEYRRFGRMIKTAVAIKKSRQ